LHADFTNGLTGWYVSGAPPAFATVEGTQLHVRVLPGQTLVLNSAALPFAHGGAAYTLTVHATIPAGSRGSGCALAIYAQTPTLELSRDSLLIEPQAVSLGSATTAADGSFSFSLAGPMPTTSTLWADYAGTSTLWPAAASVKAGFAPLQVLTTALPTSAAGTAYTQTLTASGGVAPYLWVGVGLPQGMVLGQDGSLSGTPTTAGKYTISVSVVDSADPTAVADQTLSLAVN
jgi:large repetitive protein